MAEGKLVEAREKWSNRRLSLRTLLNHAKLVFRKKNIDSKIQNSIWIESCLKNVKMQKVVLIWMVKILHPSKNSHMCPENWSNIDERKKSFFDKKKVTKWMVKVFRIMCCIDGKQNLFFHTFVVFPYRIYGFV